MNCVVAGKAVLGGVFGACPILCSVCRLFQFQTNDLVTHTILALESCKCCSVDDSNMSRMGDQSAGGRDLREVRVQLSSYLCVVRNRQNCTR